MLFCLPYPEDAGDVVLPTEVPYVAQFEYDIALPGIFERFAHENGFGDYDRPAEELASLMQSWLFFGLISEVVGRSVDHEVFVRSRGSDENTTRFIDLRLDAQLDTLLADRRTSLETKSLEHRRYISSSIRQAILTADVKAADFEKVPADPNSSLGQVALLVQLLLSHLKLWFNVAQVGGEERSTSTGQRRVPRRNYIEHRSLPHTLPMQRTSTEYVPLTAQLLFAKLRQKGWCPYRIHTTTQSLTYPTLFYLCNIDQRSSTRISHECCSFDVCRTNEQQAQTNPLKDPCHRTADCACSCVGPDLSIVGEIIDQGGVPLIEVQSSSAGTLTLKVVKCAPYTRYTAISHVWSDRQFGSEHNTLPICQIKHMHQRIQNIPTGFGRGFWAFDRLCAMICQVAFRLGWRKYPSDGQHLFWLDTFCIPGGADQQDEKLVERAKQLKFKAINMMDLIYASANEVLVLDAELENVPSGSVKCLAQGEGVLHPCHQELLAPRRERLTELLAYAFSCNWMGRAWTMQEGVLGRECLLQFQDSVLKVSRMDWRDYEPFLWITSPGRLVAGSRSSQLLMGGWRIAIQSKAVYDSWSKDASWPAHFYRRQNGAMAKAYRSTAFAILSTIVLSIAAVAFMPAVYLWWITHYIGEGPYFFRRANCQVDNAEKHISDDLRLSIERSLDPPAPFRDAPSGSRTSGQFRAAWNGLVGRCTTKSEDLHIVLANILGFNAGSMLQSMKDSGDRMNAILASSNELPLDLLFLDVDKIGKGSSDPTESSSNRWVPLIPGRGLLEIGPNMVLTNYGYRVQASYETSFTVFLVSSEVDSESTFNLQTYRRTLSPGSAMHREVLCVENCIPDQVTRNEETSESAEGTCIIFKLEGGVATKGARLSVVKYQKGSKLILRYRSALRVSTSEPGGQHPDTTLRTFPVRKPLVDTVLFLENDLSAAKRSCPRRHHNPMRVHLKWIATCSRIFGGLSLLALFIAYVTALISSQDQELTTYPDGTKGWTRTGRIHGSRATLLPIFIPLAYFIATFGYIIPRDCARYALQISEYKRWAASFETGAKASNGWVFGLYFFVSVVNERYLSSSKKST